MWLFILLCCIYKCMYILSSKETGRDTLIYQNRDTLILDTWGHYMSAHKQIKQINYINVTNIFMAVSKTSDTRMLKSFIFIRTRCKKVKISPSIWADDFIENSCQVTVTVKRGAGAAVDAELSLHTAGTGEVKDVTGVTLAAQPIFVRCENRSERRSKRQKASHRVLTNRALDILKGSTSPRSSNVKCPHDSRCEGCRKMHRMIKLCSRSSSTSMQSW